MPHPLPAHDGTGDLHSAFLADYVLVADSPVFSAIAFIVLFRTENFLVKEPAALASAGAVIYRFRLGNFPKGPFFYLVGGRQAERDLVKFSCVKSFHMFVVFPMSDLGDSPHSD